MVIREPGGNVRLNLPELCRLGEGWLGGKALEVSGNAWLCLQEGKAKHAMEVLMEGLAQQIALGVSCFFLLNINLSAAALMPLPLLCRDTLRASG